MIDFLLFPEFFVWNWQVREQLVTEHGFSEELVNERKEHINAVIESLL